MVPILKIPREELLNNGFINGYSFNKMSDNTYEDVIYLLFKPGDIDRFREFLDNEYERTKQIIEDYDYPNGFVVVVYKLDSKYANDYSLIKRGKYSLTSEAFQNEFPKVVKILVNGRHRDEISLHYRVFNKTEDLVQFWENEFNVKFSDKQELWSRFNEDDETLTEEKLKEYEQQ